MPYAPFHDKFPEIAERETRTLIILNDPKIPEDEYGLIESYCDEPGCDCRRVFFNVFSWRKREMVAVVAYGWESKSFYADWLGDDDPKVLEELQGPALNSTSRQSKFAPALLRHINFALEDQGYVKRIKRHYRMFKESVNEEAPQPSRAAPPASERKVGRNDPCPCGSGKKYKHCCARRSRR
jgi:hypothetical protein